MKQPSKEFIETFGVKTESKTDKQQTVCFDTFRFSVLTSRLIRVERTKSKKFCDKPTQAVLFRNFDRPSFKVTKDCNKVVIATKDIIFCYDLQSAKVLEITLKDGKVISGDFKKGNLKGTARTLDMINGSCPLSQGLISKNGVSVIDDSKSLTLNEDGTLGARDACRDEYFFAYGRNYRECLADFYKLCGSVPLVPRYCLGNWWSRYKAYSQEEYVSLMDKFIEKQIPISVATIDMDWHWVDVVKRFGKKDAAFQRDGFPFHNPFEFLQGDGWTGYTWNTELFPDYKAMLRRLHEKGFKVTLNIHPAQGVRPFEKMYAEMACAMGIDPKEKKHIKFNIANPQYIEAYFNVLHRPYEKDGVDFWWIDWQQEKTTSIPGLDPLWALNHYHTLAFNGQNKRPLILSRFAKVGSHRYPLGFSGDTIISWKSLDFQPYFTITAANVGYTWWSHDIGGHQLGSRNDELYARWVQFGQYSPIMRLHSTNDEFMGKEPWKYSYGCSLAAINAMRERHAMIPYIYSMNRRTHKDSIALCEPMYYSYPNEKEAYENKNEYFFGSELLVVPITEPMSKKTNLAKARVWLPKGTWTDIYTGYAYEGGQTVEMFRGIESIPVLAKEGAILPLSKNDKTNDCSNPDSMVIRIYKGTNEFELYEDDGETMNFEKGQFATTKFEIRQTGNNVTFKINKAQGDLSVIPARRSYTLVFEDIESAVLIKSSAQCDISRSNGKTVIDVSSLEPTEEISVDFESIKPRKNPNKHELIVELLSKYQLPTIYKKLHFDSYVKDISKPFPINDNDLKGPIDEVFKMR